MTHHPSRGRRPGRALLGVAATVLAGTLAFSGCASGTATTSASTPAADNATALLTIPREDMGTFTRNFNPFSPNAAPMTTQAIHESMLIYNPAAGNTVPWLATEWAASDDNRTLTFTLRDGVQWSDGEPLVADDVAYTFELQKEIMGGFEYLDSVTASDAHTVVFTFSRDYSPALYEIGQMPIVPKHVWEAIEDPAKATNETPVGTGPYTEITNFAAQSFTLGKNPHYWQPDAQHIEGIKMLAFAGNDGANLAAANGDVDWAPQYIPNIERTFISRDPEHRHYWFPPTGSMINFMVNTTKAPFNDVNVRKALSMAIDREQIVSVGMSGYTEPADCTGLSGSYETWKDASLQDSCDWIERDVDAANALLDEAGYPKGADGQRTLPDGSPFTFDFSVGSTSSDWVSVANVISQNLADVGITMTVDAPDWSAVVAGYETGDFDSGIVWSSNDPTPYQYYLNLMSPTKVKPVGEQTHDNYGRFGSADAQALLDQFAATQDEETQHEIVDDLQALYGQELPTIPLFPGPEWGAYNDSRFVGWPTADDPYATLGTRAPTTVLVLTTLEPR
ncbi:ABC transporter substrate-binding protein [Propioniciclava soli]|uniref:ABC transporter substrate-binding protein n=1 Tax=Propioniciclava soli TaxID=2775081 RepID=A0ABZ3C3Y0_9ACTN|nr:ABC transporter substrate-binding protein [Propioniciclava soli]